MHRPASSPRDSIHSSVVEHLRNVTSESFFMHSSPGTTCVLCGHSGSFLHRGLRDRLFGSPGQWNVLTCMNHMCDLHWIHPFPSAEELARSYSNYYTHDAPSAPCLPGVAARSVAYGLLGLAREHHALDRLLVTPGDGHLLELGFGSGARLPTFARMGWRVHGQELDPACVARARAAGFTAHLGDLTQLRLPSRRFKYIVGSHVIEHVRDPIAFMTECYRLLHPGGRLILRTPNPAGYSHSAFGTEWRGLEPPRHLFLFGPASMTSLLRRAGFRHFDVRTTAARTLGMIRESLKLQPVTSAVRVHLLTLKHAFWARWRFGLDSCTGDEVVVDATRR